MKESKRRIGYFVSTTWVIVTILIQALIFLKRVSLSSFPVKYTMAIVSFGSIIVFWAIILALSNFGIGLRAFVQMLYKEPITDRTETEKQQKQLLDKLNATRSTTVGFASITTAIIGIIIAITMTWGSAKPVHIEAIIFVTTFLLILATIVLIHCIDMCDTAINPRLPISMLKRIRTNAMNYYAIGLFFLLAGLFLGIAVIHPYLTVVTCITYMLIVLHYFFMWETNGKSF
jgi:hypothetical protein